MYTNIDMNFSLPLIVFVCIYHRRKRCRLV